MIAGCPEKLPDSLCSYGELMNITLIYGSQRHGSTWHIAQKFVSELACGGEIREFYLPESLPKMCCGCGVCFIQGAQFCPHRQYVEPMVRALDQADLIILASATSVFHVTGAMKNFLDHLAYRWMIHRPSPTMFTKSALAITTAAGGGMKSTLKDMTDSLSYWGVGKIWTYGKAVYALEWGHVPEHIKKAIDRDVKRLSDKIGQGGSAAVPTAAMQRKFHAMRIFHKAVLLSQLDREHWGINGWLDKERPWDTVTRVPEDLS